MRSALIRLALALAVIVTAVAGPLAPKAAASPCGVFNQSWQMRTSDGGYMYGYIAAPYCYAPNGGTPNGNPQMHVTSSTMPYVGMPSATSWNSPNWYLTASVQGQRTCLWYGQNQPVGINIFAQAVWNVSTKAWQMIDWVNVSQNNCRLSARMIY